MSAGQRAEGFYVDLGSIFDLGDLRPFASAHAHYGLAKYPVNGPDVNATKKLNVHSLALQVPISDLTRGGWTGTTVSDPRAVIGADLSEPPAGAAVRRRARRDPQAAGPSPRSPAWAIRCSTRSSCRWARRTTGTRCFRPTTSNSPRTWPKAELAALLPSLYPGVFPNLDALSKSGKPRTDLEAILLTGIPSGLIPGFQNYTGSTQADMLRLNTAIKPTATPSIYGRVGGRPGRACNSVLADVDMSAAVIHSAIASHRADWCRFPPLQGTAPRCMLPLKHGDPARCGKPKSTSIET